MKLTAKQERFVSEYLIDLNATQAAIRAGYSERTAEQQGYQLLQKTSVAEAISKAQNKTATKLEITKERIIEELAKIAFADMRKAVKWGPTQNTKEMIDGTVVVSSGVTLIDSNEIDDDTAAAVSEVANTREGVKIKLHDKKSALVDLAKMLGFMVEKHEHTGKDGKPIEVKTLADFYTNPQSGTS
ncbi:terminase small subunit [Pseudochrobactrum asaccharolyticum]|uniref:Phage terminase small subunit n=1 Tax=Pseudochrobactrum asaccharolyticum TaxID=354351 RepID=A0A366DLT0_9HYPH|nr:terminase small subunit [Pseudochrobactrum asaccharolyticum]RBO91043.1 phage terminase small subunit [Pseudochrobactrum asaccharolyticum]